MWQCIEDECVDECVESNVQELQGKQDRRVIGLCS